MEGLLKALEKFLGGPAYAFSAASVPINKQCQRKGPAELTFHANGNRRAPQSSRFPLCFRANGNGRAPQSLRFPLFFALLSD